MAPLALSAVFKEVRVHDSPGNDVPSTLIDLSDVGLGDLAVLDQLENPVLTATLRRIRDEIENPTEAVAGFNSCL